jgi:hypothetical protein
MTGIRSSSLPNDSSEYEVEIRIDSFQRIRAYPASAAPRCEIRRGAHAAPRDFCFAGDFGLPAPSQTDIAGASTKSYRLQYGVSNIAFETGATQWPADCQEKHAW